MTKALIILDAQVNMFADDTATYQAASLLERLAGVIARARQSGLPVFYVQNNGGPGYPGEPGTPGLGYTVTLVEDAHSTFDDDLPANEIIA